MSVPVTRTLEAVLGEALSQPAGLRLVVGVVASQPADTRYVNVTIGATTVKVPQLKGAIGAGSTGKVVYLLADETRMLAIGIVST